MIRSKTTREIYQQLVPSIAKVLDRDVAWVNELCGQDPHDRRITDGHWPSTQQLSMEWAASNKDTAAEGTLYGDDRYVLDSLYTYLFFSRDYVNRIENLIKQEPLFREAFNDVKTLIDFGGGIGLSSIHLQEMFDSLNMNVNVIYHNVDTATKQNELAQIILAETNVKTCTEIDVPVQAFFMSEVLEHMRSPVKFVRDVVIPRRPNVIIHASSFCKPEYAGHFTHYDISPNDDGVFIEGSKRVSERLHRWIKSQGYKKIDHRALWNHRPVVFIKGCTQ